jgi:hypothetical protein
MHVYHKTERERLDKRSHSCVYYMFLELLLLQQIHTASTTIVCVMLLVLLPMVLLLPS